MGTLKKASLFPPKLQEKVVNLVKGHSSLVKLSARDAIKFNGNDVFTFNFDNEASIVGESEAKVHGGITIAPVQMKPFKVEYGARVTAEFMNAAEEDRINLLQEFSDGFAKAVARALDIAAIHGLNPRTGNASTVIGNNNLDYMIPAASKISDQGSGDYAYSSLDEAIAAVQDQGYDVTGIATNATFKSALSRAVSAQGVALLPELKLGNTPEQLAGRPYDCNSTISFGTEVEAIVGDFKNYFKWGVAKNATIEVIPYGDPDNSGYDLAGHNEVYVRGEMYIGYGIFDAKAFAEVGNFQ